MKFIFKVVFSRNNIPGEDIALETVLFSNIFAVKTFLTSNFTPQNALSLSGYFSLL